MVPAPFGRSRGHVGATVCHCSWGTVRLAFGSPTQHSEVCASSNERCSRPRGLCINTFLQVMSPEYQRMEVVNTGSGLLFPRGNTATHPWHSTGGTRIIAVWHQRTLLSLLSTTTGFSNADSDILRYELQRAHADEHAATAANSACYALNYHQIGVMNAAQQNEQETRDRAEVVVAEATAQTQADKLHELSGIEQIAENTVSNQ